MDTYIQGFSSPVLAFSNPAPSPAFSVGGPGQTGVAPLFSRDKLSTIFEGVLFAGVLSKVNKPRDIFWFLAQLIGFHFHGGPYVARSCCFRAILPFRPG
jgi:hypothetical protein